MTDLSLTVRIALQALWVNKTRSFLTVLGIIIGVGAVIAMLAVGQGASRKISLQISSVGSNLLVVLPGAVTSGGLRLGLGTQMTLNIGDAEAIEKECSFVEAVSPVLNGVAQVVYGNNNWSTAVHGVGVHILTIRDANLISGRPFSEQEIRSASKVCLLGQTVVENLFGEVDPVGKTIRIKGVPFTIIGVLERKGQSLMGQDQDDVVYIPITTAQKRIFGTHFPGMVRQILVKAKSINDMERAEEEINALLRQRHRIGPKSEPDFSVRNMTQLLQVAEQSARIMTLLLGAVASVSLLVGGIGIMNIMLVSVTERTREIGIRMAVGAKVRDIRFQFLVEAVTLSLAGGIIGIFAGVLVSWLISTFAGWETMISPLSIALAVGFAALVGISFGYYPAYRASTLNPIEALRHE